MLTLYQISISSAKHNQISIGIASRSVIRYMIFSDGGWTKASMGLGYGPFVQPSLLRLTDNDFKLDCMNLISKTPGFPDAPVSKAGSYYQPANCLFANG